MTDKKAAFRYVVFKLIEWYKSEKQITTVADFNQHNDFSVLKVLKLLYFTVAVDAKNNSLLNTFDNFVAMPFGHVESDIYDFLKNGRTPFPDMTINKKCIIEDTFETSFSDFIATNSTTKKEIDKAIELLKKFNGNDFIEHDAFEYVDMSHALYSWKVFYNKAKSDGNRSAYIDHSYIRRDGQYFILESAF